MSEGILTLGIALESYITCMYTHTLRNRNAWTETFYTQKNSYKHTAYNQFLLDEELEVVIDIQLHSLQFEDRC